MMLLPKEQAYNNKDHHHHHLATKNEVFLFNNDKKEDGNRNKFPSYPNNAAIRFEIKRGRWSTWEKQAFLRGLRHFGKGKWKKIGTLIPTRTTIQVKTHAQMILRRIKEGEDIFADLKDNNDVDNDEENSNLKRNSSHRQYHGKKKNAHYFLSMQLKMTPERKDLEAAKVLVEMQNVSSSSSSKR